MRAKLSQKSIPAWSPERHMNQVVRDMPPSGIRKFFDLVSEMDGAISLGVGEPDFVTPWHVREACIYSLESGNTHYTSNKGMPELSMTPDAQLTRNEVNDVVASAMASATPRPPDSVRVYQVIQPSLVLIETERDGENGERDLGLGSGTVINQNGDILTSLHVVDNATSISLTFADGTKAEGTIISSSPEIDIAMVSASVLPQVLVPATIGNPGAMQVGDEAYVVGNPFGLYSSMSAGVISGFDRVYHPPNLPGVIRGLIQVDAAINPGNSGGPLLNSNGHVVGVVTGIVNPTEDSFFIGIGFAVPINVAAGGGGGLPPY